MSGSVPKSVQLRYSNRIAAIDVQNTTIHHYFCILTDSCQNAKYQINKSVFLSFFSAALPIHTPETLPSPFFLCSRHDDRQIGFSFTEVTAKDAFHQRQARSFSVCYVALIPFTQANASILQHPRYPFSLISKHLQKQKTPSLP